MRVCVRAPFYRHPHLLRFSFRPLNILFPSLSSLLFFFFFFFLFLRVCIHTRDSVCSIFLLVHYDYTRLHEALSSLFTSKFCYSTPHVYFRRRLSSPHRHSSTYCFSLCEPKFHVYIYIYISIHTYIIYIYVYVCITVSAVSPMYHTASSLDLPL